MSKKPLHKPLEGLFASLNQTISPSSSGREEPLPGWTWECDEYGNYLTCSPEVEEVLGFSPQDFLGQPLTSFGLTPESAMALKTTLENGELPIQIALDFRSRGEETIPITLHVFAAPPQNGDNIRWRGFVQVMVHKEGPADPYEISHPKRESEFRDLKAEAREKVLAILKQRRPNSEPVAQSRRRRITSKEREELRDDRTRKPIPTGQFAGRETYTYPKVAVHQVEFKLEWGNKLDLTEKEKRFLASRKFREPGMRGYLQQRSAPRKIVKCDAHWIGVCIEIEEGGTQRVWVNHPGAQGTTTGYDLMEFLENPEILLPELNKALDHPWRSRVDLQIGEDFLIPR